MGITVFPFTPEFGAEIGDVDLSQELDAATFSEIEQAFWKYSVLVFPSQTLTQEQHMSFAKRFGPLEGGSASDRKKDPLRIHQDLTDVSNLTPEGKLWGTASRKRQFELANRLWHSDASFRLVPAYASLLYGREIAPIGGHTEFSDQRAAYDALSEAMKARLAGLVAEHSIFNSRGRIGFSDFNEEDRRAMPPVPQSVVRTIPQNGRKTLYMSSHAGRILGMGEAEGNRLIDQLIEHSVQRQFVHIHRWRQNDLIMWDNRCTMHRATGFDDLRWRRDVQRATVRDRGNSCEQEGLKAS